MTFREAFDPFRALGAGWQLFLKAPLTLLLGGFLLLVAGSGGNGNQFTGSSGGHMSDEETALFVLIACLGCLLVVALFLLQCLLLIGFPNAVERVASTGEEEVGDLFRAKGRYLSMVLMSIVSILIAIASVLPGALLGLLAGLVTGGVTGAPELGLGVGGVTAALVVIPMLVYVWLGIALAPYAVALEGMAPMDSLRRSWELARGNRLALLLYAIVMFVVTLAGALLCCVGIIATSAIAQAAWSESYLRLVRSSEEQAGWWLEDAAAPGST